MIFAVDPLYLEGVGLAEVLITLLKVVVAFAALMVGVMLMIWFERKVVGDMQNRIGPNRAGPWGIMQTLADGIKLFFKEDLIPQRSNRFVFQLAPYMSLVPAFLIFTVVPIGGDFDGGNGTVSIFGHETYLQVADPSIGILFVLAMSSMAVYGVMLAGWSSGSKYPLLGSVRASAQMVSYEAALGLSIGAVLIQSGTLSTHGIALEQSEWDWNLWLTAFVPFIVFLIAATAELNRPPFDLVEAEQELVGGFHTEYSSIRFALFFLAEYMNVITMSAIIVTLFLGGPSGWYPPGPGWLYGMIWFFAKLLVLLFSFVWFRGTLPRLRYDQLMDLGWKLLIPLSLGWLLVLAAIEIGDDRGWNRFAVGAVSAAVLAVGAGLLVLAIRAGARTREVEEVFA